MSKNDVFERYKRNRAKKSTSVVTLLTKTLLLRLKLQLKSKKAITNYTEDDLYLRGLVLLAKNEGIDISDIIPEEQLSEILEQMEN